MDKFFLELEVTIGIFEFYRIVDKMFFLDKLFGEKENFYLFKINKVLFWYERWERRLDYQRLFYILLVLVF